MTHGMLSLYATVDDVFALATIADGLATLVALLRLPTLTGPTTVESAASMNEPIPHVHAGFASPARPPAPPALPSAITLSAPQ